MNILDLERSKIEFLEEIKLSVGGIYLKARKMEDLCLKKGIISLSAVQTGLPINLFVYWVNFPDKKSSFSYFYDCIYEPLSNNKFVSIESCASLGGDMARRFKINRYDSILVSGKKFTDNGKLIDFEFNYSKGIDCVVFQHEIDHYNNILISNIGEEIYITKGFQ